MISILLCELRPVLIYLFLLSWVVYANQNKRRIETDVMKLYATSASGLNLTQEYSYHAQADVGLRGQPRER